MEDSKPLTIGALSRATRIPAETLRTWERRYGSPKPARKASGHRLYPVEWVEQLRRVARLLERGHRPSEIVALSTRRLDTLLALSETARVSAVPARAAGPEDHGLDRSIRRMVEATRAFERETLMGELRANWIRLGPLRFLEACAGPLMAQVGLGWHGGTLEVRHEHFASGCMSDLLREVREPYERDATGARVAVAALPGESHEGGLLMVSVLLALRGHRVVYLGANTPVEQIAASVRGGGADAVALSVSSAAPRARSAKQIAGLRRLLPRRVPIWVGGAGAPHAGAGVDHFATLSELDARLRERA